MAREVHIVIRHGEIGSHGYNKVMFALFVGIKHGLQILV